MNHLALKNYIFNANFAGFRKSSICSKRAIFG